MKQSEKELKKTSSGRQRGMKMEIVSLVKMQI